jgi:hypothetical protein
MNRILCISHWQQLTPSLRVEIGKYICNGAYGLAIEIAREFFREEIVRITIREMEVSA